MRMWRHSVDIGDRSISPLVAGSVSADHDTVVPMQGCII